jgi:flagellar hook-basal body complex protein FliE
MDFTLGNTDSTHELTVAQQKAYLSLQYTVAVKNGFLDAYKEIMQIQI